MSKVHKIRLSREALLKAVEQIVKEQSAGMAGMDCVRMSAVLEGNGIGGSIIAETFPLDTIEVELVRAVAVPQRKIGKLSLAAVNGERVA